jgi:hypothetical protein
MRCTKRLRLAPQSCRCLGIKAFGFTKAVTDLEKRDTGYGIQVYAIVRINQKILSALIHTLCLAIVGGIGVCLPGVELQKNC